MVKQNSCETVGHSMIRPAVPYFFEEIQLSLISFRGFFSLFWRSKSETMVVWVSHTQQKNATDRSAKPTQQPPEAVTASQDWGSGNVLALGH